ncbi:PHB depolymerase family esterase [Halomonas sp. PA5]|nr:PHB depolymerase family esterase [Halomonas sp. PA5]
MNRTLMADLQEATRLTQAGQLQEATAMLQRALGGVSNPDGVESASTPERGAHSAWGKADRTRQGVVLEGDYRVVNDTPSRSSKSTAGASRGSGEFLSGSFKNHAGSRDYKLYIPSAYHGQSLPLVVMLHGCTQNPDDFALGTGMNTLAEAQPCFVLYPAQPASANSSKCWNWFKASDQQRDHGEPAILAGMTRHIVESHQLDERRIYVAGLSAGGAMATTLAMTYPDLYAAVGIHSGLPHAAAHDLPSALAAMQGGAGTRSHVNVPGMKMSGMHRSGMAGSGINSQEAGTRRSNFGQQGSGSASKGKIPAVIFHGDRDSTVHPCNGQRVAAQYVDPDAVSQTREERGQVANGHGYTRTLHHDASDHVLMEQWTIHGAGHAWAGGSARGSYTDPKGPDASKEMLRFFLAHPKRE